MKKVMSVILSLIVVMNLVVPVMATTEEFNIEAESQDIQDEILEEEPLVTPIITNVPTVEPEPTVIPTVVPVDETMDVPVEEQTVEQIVEPNDEEIAEENIALPTPDPNAKERAENLEQYSAGDYETTEFGEAFNFGFYMDTPTMTARNARATSGNYGGLKWVFDAVTGTLSLTGKGAVPQRLSTTVLPWEAHISSITKLNIGSGITVIETAAFYKHYYLTTVTLPNTLISIDEAAFADCSSLKDINLPNSLKSIGRYAFQNCRLTSVAIPKSVTSIDQLAFFRCYQLSTMTVASDNVTYSVINNILYSKDKKTLLIAPCGHQSGNISIPNGTVKIERGAFAYSRLTNITIPNTVKTIGDQAFFGSALTSLTIPDSVTEIGISLAEECYELKNAKIGNGIKKLPNTAFAYCSALTMVTLPKGIKEISRASFGACSSLSSITLPSELEMIGTQAFFDCSSLKNISFPNKLKEIQEIAFWNTGLTKVTLPSTVDKVGYDAFPRNCQVIYPSGLTKMDDGSYMKVAVLYLDSQAKYSEAFDVLKIVNQERKKVGAPELKMDKELLTAAMLRAEEISVYFSHDRPTGIDCFTVSNKIFGENIAAGSSVSTGVMNQWMDSPGHKSNILSASYKSIGIGCAVVDGATYWVQVFGIDGASVASASSYKNQKREAKIVVDPYAEFYKPKLTVAKDKLDVGATSTLAYSCYNNWINTEVRAKSFTFTSSNAAICSVDASGKITAKNVGTATISAYPKGFSGAVKSVKITVNAKQSFTVKYNANKGSGKMTDTTVVFGKSTALRANTFKRTGYTFGGWNFHRKSDNKWLYTKGGKDGWYKKGKQPAGYKLKVHNNKVKLSKTSSKNKDIVTAYVVWKANKYTVSYNKNGGKGKISNTKATYAKNAKLKSNTFKRNKYRFNGWTAYRKSDKKWLYVKGSKSQWYTKGQQPKGYKLKVLKNKVNIKNLTPVNNDRITMYAKWKK